MFGGETTDCFVLSSGEVYDAVTDSWRPLPPMPNIRSYFACAGLDGLVYAVGGWSVDGGTASMDIYDPAPASYGRAFFPSPPPRGALG